MYSDALQNTVAFFQLLLMTALGLKCRKIRLYILSQQSCVPHSKLVHPLTARVLIHPLTARVLIHPLTARVLSQQQACT